MISVVILLELYLKLVRQKWSVSLTLNLLSTQILTISKKLYFVDNPPHSSNVLRITVQEF